MRRTTALICALAAGGALASGATAAPGPLAPPEAGAHAAHAASPAATTSAARTPAVRQRAARARIARQRAARVRIARRRAAVVRRAQFRKLRGLNAQYVKLQRTARVCAPPRATLVAANRLRAVALRGASVRDAPARSRARQVRMTAAIVRLARATGGCTVPGAAVTPIAPSPSQVVTRPRTGAPGAPGGPGTPGAPGAPAAPVAPGTPPAATPAPATQVTRIDLAPVSLLGSTPIDLSGIVGTTLPEILAVVPLQELSDLACNATGVVCIGIDPADLGATLHELVATAPFLTRLVLTPLLQPVTALLATNPAAVGDLFQVIDLGGGVLKVIPSGLLGTLLTTVNGLLTPLNQLLGSLPGLGGTGAGSLPVDLGVLQILR